MISLNLEESGNVIMDKRKIMNLHLISSWERQSCSTVWVNIGSLMEECIWGLLQRKFSPYPKIAIYCNHLSYIPNLPYIAKIYHILFISIKFIKNVVHMKCKMWIIKTKCWLLVRDISLTGSRAVRSVHLFIVLASSPNSINTMHHEFYYCIN